MKEPARKAFLFVVSVVVMLIVGCGQEEAPSVKKSRAIAAENMALKKQLKQRSSEIEKLKEQHDKKIKEQQKLITANLQEIEKLRLKSKRSIRNQVKGVLDTVMEENAKLREENEKLKAQIKDLEKEPE